MAVSGKIIVGTDDAQRNIATLVRAARSSEDTTPGLFWLGGFKSDMMGSKAIALDEIGAELGVSVTRFDYSGHGISDGAFLDGSISQWLEDALAVFNQTSGPQILVGSSMGGWIAMLLNQKITAHAPERIAGMILIAPAIDMTEDLMRATFTDKELVDLEHKGRVEQPSDYSDEPYVLTAKLIKDGEKHILFGKGTLSTQCPVIILQGGQDTDVPPSHAMKLLTHLAHDPVVFTLIPDGDHRLSTEKDILKLKKAATQLVNGEIS